MNQHDTQNNQGDRAGAHDPGHDIRADQQKPRRNPRLVIGTLDYFDMLMEQDEEG